MIEIRCTDAVVLFSTACDWGLGRALLKPNIAKIENGHYYLAKDMDDCYLACRRTEECSMFLYAFPEEEGGNECILLPDVHNKELILPINTEKEIL